MLTAALTRLPRLVALPLLALTLCTARAGAQASIPLLNYDPVRGYYDPVSGFVFGQAIPTTYTNGDPPMQETLPGLKFTDASGNPLSTTPDTTIATLSYPVEIGYVNTDIAQTDHTYSTTLDAAVGGSSIFDVTFALPFSDPTVQAAVTQADALLAGAGAAFSAPTLVSSVLTGLGSQTTTQQTGQSSVASAPVTTQYVGPAIIPIYDGGPQPAYYNYVFFSGIDYNTVLDTQVTVDQTVTTTTTDLLTQTYDITGTPRAATAVPEPSPLALLALGLLPVGLLAHRKSTRRG